MKDHSQKALQGIKGSVRFPGKYLFAKWKHWQFHREIESWTSSAKQNGPQNWLRDTARNHHWGRTRHSCRISSAEQVAFLGCCHWRIPCSLFSTYSYYFPWLYTFSRNHKKKRSIIHNLHLSCIRFMKALAEQRAFFSSFHAEKNIKLLIFLYLI